MSFVDVIATEGFCDCTETIEVVVPIPVIIVWVTVLVDVFVNVLVDVLVDVSVVALIPDS
jgi:hypothetical protein